MRTIIVIPAYNESERLPPYAKEIYQTFNGFSEVCFQVVDDGSEAEHQSLVNRAISELSPVFLPPLILGKNLGKGGAIRSAWNHVIENTSAQWLGFVDADGAISAGEVRRLCDKISTEDRIDAVFSSRIKMLGKTVQRNWRRHLAGRMFATIIGATICDKVYDTQCGFKLIKRSVWEALSASVTESGFAFDVDLLCGLLHNNATVMEEPIDWIDIPGSKVSLLSDSLKILQATLRIRKRWEQQPDADFEQASDKPAVPAAAKR
ncbi:MAG: glycosyltransferase [Verrucomicrobiales bacterium]